MPEQVGTRNTPGLLAELSWSLLDCGGGGPPCGGVDGVFFVMLRVVTGMLSAVNEKGERLSIHFDL